MRARIAIACLALVASGSAARGGDLAPGDAAPGFALPGSDGRMHRLADQVGRRGVVLAWFPKAFTPG